ncbi:MAG: hypothetical protein AAGI88_04930 [Pseudomonadota bacterium]
MRKPNPQPAGNVARKALATVTCVIAGLVITGVLYSLTEHPEQSRACNAASLDIAALVMSENATAMDSLANRAILKRGLCAPSGSTSTPPP